MKTNWTHLFLFVIGLAFNSHAQAPVASFTGSTLKCSGKTIIFSDQSSNSPTAWNWSFPGGSPSSSSVQNPTVTYAVAGVYTVTMFASVTNFTGSPISQTISVAASPTLSIISPATQAPCSWESATLSATGANTYTWFPGALTGSTVLVPGQATTIYTLVGSLGSCNTTTTALLIINPTPTLSPSISMDYFCSGDSSATIFIPPSPATTYSWSNGSFGPVLVVSPPANQTFTCYIKGNNMCQTRIAQLMLAPDATVTVSSATICAGSQTTLCANSTVAMTFTWLPTTSLSNISGNWGCVIANPPATTNYTVIGLEIFSQTTPCPGSASITITVLPSPTLTVSSATLCVGESQSICVTGANSYTWTNISSLNSYSVSCPVASPSLTTTYSVTGKGSNGCTKNASSQVIVNICSGIHEKQEIENIFEIFPNPNSGSFFVRFKTKEEGELEMYNTLGELVYSQNLRDSNNSIALKMPKGIYYARINYTSAKALIQKIVVE